MVVKHMSKLLESPSAEQILFDNGYENVVIFKNPNYDTALIGVSEDNRAVYSYDKMVEYLMEYEGMSEDDACDFICSDTIRSLPYVEGAPIVVYELMQTIN